MTPTSKKKFELSVHFRGVRGSYVISGKEFLKYGGHTTCYEVHAGDCLIIVDAGSGIIDLGNDLIQSYAASGKSLETRTPIKALILFSHLHVDHVQGLPFFSPIFLPDSTFYIYGPDTQYSTFQDAVDELITPPYYQISLDDMYSLKLFRSISQVDSIYWSQKQGIPFVINDYREFERKKQIEKDNDVRISCMKNYAHPNGGVMIFRINYNDKSVVIATDIEGYVYGDTRLINFAKNADLLIHDAGYTKDMYKSLNQNKQGFGHSTMEMAIKVAKKANVGRLALVHHDPAYDDKTIAAIERSAQKLYPECFAAYEGQKIKL